MYYKGQVALSAGVKKALSGASDAATTDYGDSCKCLHISGGIKLT
jgi:hypothetical protein